MGGNISAKDKLLHGIKYRMNAGMHIKNIEQINSLAGYVDDHDMQIEVILRVMDWIGKKNDIINPIKYLDSILLDYCKKGIINLNDYERHLQEVSNDAEQQTGTEKKLAKEERRNVEENDINEYIKRKEREFEEKFKS